MKRMKFGKTIDFINNKRRNKHMKKRILAGILALVMALALAACGSSAGSESGSSAPAGQQDSGFATLNASAPARILFFMCLFLLFVL